MIPNICFLQFVAVTTTQSQPPSFKAARSIPTAQNHEYWLGLIIATALHIAGFVLLGNDNVESTITPPPPIMVNWVSAPAGPAFKPQPPVQKTAPSLEPVKAKAKTQPKPAKTQPVIATPVETASAMTSPINEPASTPPTETTNATTASSSASTESTTTDASQAALTLPNLHADYLNNPTPTYPRLSREQGEQGKVLLRVFVNAEGQVQQVSLRKTSGHERLDSAAQETVKQWRFVPAHRGAQAVSAWVVVPVSFSLEG